ncbi:MAG: FliG C-terminal domain-containing protein [Thermoguttaceae bacterium]|jgi:flagellar motor switch protein FliG
MDVATISFHDAGIRKAAILVASLDQAAADLLLRQLGPERADLVRQAVAYLDEIGPEERQRIGDEFRRIGPMVPSQSPSGIELDRLPAGKTSLAGKSVGQTFLSATKPSTGQTGMSALPAGDEPPPFDFLRDADDEKLARLLGDERPATVALVLSNLPPERAGEVLARLAPAAQIEVVRRLVDLDNSDSETLGEIEKALEARWLQQFAIDRRRAAGPEAVARILATCDAAARGRILGNLAAHDQSLAERLGQRPIAFEEIAQFDDAVLTAVYRTAKPEVLQAALLGAPPSLLERLLRRMSRSEAKQLRHKLAHPGPIRLSDVEEAQRQIAVLVQQISRERPRKAA